MGDERGMDPEGRAGDARPDPKALRGLGDAAQHCPHEGTLALFVRPRVVVIRNEGEPETAGFGAAA